MAAAIAVTAPDVAAVGQTRTLSFYNMHTKESLTVTYKKSGRYIPSALKKINHILRDWRRDAVIRIDPKLIDLVYELHEELGSRKPVHIISGYRSPKTNTMLKSVGRNVATRSKHMDGQAIDIFLPDVDTKALRNSALVRQVGGVGFYPRSGKHGFVHIDTGRVRHWPGIPKAEYAAIFKNHKKRPAPRKEEPKPDFLMASAPPVPRQKPAALTAVASDESEQQDAPLIVADAPLPEPRPEGTASQIASVDNLRVEPAAAQPAERRSFAARRPATAGDIGLGPIFGAKQRRVVSDPSLDPPVIEPLSTLASSSMTGDLDKPRRLFFPARPERTADVQQASLDPDIRVSMLPPILDGLKRLFTGSGSEPTILNEDDLVPVGGQEINRADKGDLLMTGDLHVTPNADGKGSRLGEAHASLAARPALRGRHHDPLDPAPLLPFE